MIENPQKPQSQNADLTNLPAALAPLCQLPHWVNWKWEQRASKGTLQWTKPPYQPTGVKAKSDTPGTWSDYQAVLEAFNRGKFDGIGLMLRTTTLTTIDLDHALDDNGQPDPWAIELLRVANGTYVERTPSGKGLRIIGVGPGERLQRRWTIKDGREGAAIEIYRNCERYITITGNQVGDCTKLQIFDADPIVQRYDKAKLSTKKNTSGSFDFNDTGPQPSSIDYDALIRNGAPNGQRSELFQACIWHLAAKGLSVEEIVAELTQHPHGIGEKYAGRLHEEVERSYEKWQSKRQPNPALDIEEEEEEEPEEPTHWDTVDKSGKPTPTYTNTKRAINGLNIRCRYNVFHDRFRVEGKVIKEDPEANLDYIVRIVRDKIHKAFGFDPGTKHTNDAIIALCLANKFDPVLDYLNALQWDGTPRLEHWLITYAGAGNTPLNREFGRIALVAAVRRARYPGIKFDPIIVLEGPMGTNKSKAIEILAGVENFSDQSIFGVRDREQQELLAGVWLYEIAELSIIRKTEAEHIKAFASRTHDRARPAYGHHRVDQPRRCVLFATTNNDQYLKEKDRRFWPVKTANIDIEALKRDRDQLWAEPTQQEREGASITLRRELWDAAGIEQQAREEGDPWDDVLSEAIGDIEQGEERISSADLLSIVLKIDISKQRDIDFKRLGRCMRRLGWSGPKLIRIGGRTPKMGYRRLTKKKE